MKASGRRHMPFLVLENLYEELVQVHRSKAELVHHLSDLLNVSIESVYRRLRGASSFTLEELWCIVNHYSISLDKVLSACTSGDEFHLHHHTSFKKWTQLSIEKNGKPLSVIEKSVGIPKSILSQLPTLRLIIQDDYSLHCTDCKLNVVLSFSFFEDLKNVLTDFLHEGKSKTTQTKIMGVLSEVAKVLYNEFNNSWSTRFYHASQLVENPSLILIYPNGRCLSVYQLGNSVIEFADMDSGLDHLAGCVPLDSSTIKSRLFRKSYVYRFNELGCNLLGTDSMRNILIQSNLMQFLDRQLK